MLLALTNKKCCLAPMLHHFSIPSYSIKLYPPSECSASKNEVLLKIKGDSLIKFWVWFRIALVFTLMSCMPADYSATFAFTLYMWPFLSKYAWGYCEKNDKHLKTQSEGKLPFRRHTLSLSISLTLSSYSCLSLFSPFYFSFPSQLSLRPIGLFLWSKCNRHHMHVRKKLNTEDSILIFMIIIPNFATKVDIVSEKNVWIDYTDHNMLLISKFSTGKG